MCFLEKQIQRAKEFIKWTNEVNGSTKCNKLKRSASFGWKNIEIALNWDHFLVNFERKRL